MMGYDFHRQKPLNQYIVDFFCNELMLTIEIDGDSHDNEEAVLKDEKRQTKLESLGINFIRFDDLDVKKEMGFVLETIENWIIDFEEKYGRSI